jgi:hypothetical protein
MSAVRTPSLLARTVLTVAEAYCPGRRVALIAAGASGLAEGLIAAGARSVHHYATDPERPARPTRSDRTLLVRELPAGDFDVREGAFDLVVVEDLARLGDVPSWLGRFRRLVGASGTFVGGAPRRSDCEPNAHAFGVHELDELVSVQFAWVDLRGLASFHGALVAPIGAQGAIGEFVLYPLDDGRAAPEELVVIASQKARAVEPSLLLEVEPPPRRVESSRVAVTPANDSAREGMLEALRSEHARALTKVAEERADLLDTIALREQALRASEAEGDRLRGEVDELTAHLDRALAGAVPAHLARLEALADKDRPRVVEAPMALAERERFEAELAAADAARAEADDACLRTEAALRRSEQARKYLESELHATRTAADAQRERAEALVGEIEVFEACAGDEVSELETRLVTLATDAARAREAERFAERFLAADRLRGSAIATDSSSRVADEAALLRDLLRERARADVLALEIQALRSRMARIVEAVDEAASSSVDTEAPEPRLAGVSPPSAASSRPAVPGPHSDDG